MALKWYVVHVYSGFENKVKASLEERITAFPDPEKFGEIVVPTEQVVELVKGKKKESSRKFYPGYILIRMALDEVPGITIHFTGEYDPHCLEQFVRWDPFDAGKVDALLYDQRHGLLILYHSVRALRFHCFPVEGGQIGFRHVTYGGWFRFRHG